MEYKVRLFIISHKIHYNYLLFYRCLEENGWNYENSLTAFNVVNVSLFDLTIIFINFILFNTYRLRGKSLLKRFLNPCNDKL